ncbi:MAG: xylan 1,4-beta-xylosidase, partial [Acidobacteriaceae bacterium]|nr:xylan 1,4-beta-xylosidase [Acidobacteriaceae bacterium]
PFLPIEKASPLVAIGRLARVLVMLRKYRFSAVVLGLSVFLAACCPLFAQEQIQIDARAPTTPFPHFWEQMFGSGRAILTLRESYREDLRAVKQITDFQYVRFHAILHDEVGVYNEDQHGNPVYNFSYVDQIYDGLLKQGIRPVVEISFMPKKLAFNPDALHPFWYKQNVSPPKSLEAWDALMTHFAQHLVERYGIDEVSQWYFEVWNEPNIDFWNGIPRKQSYFELYAHTARALKAVSPRLRVGGPATAAASWVDDFLKYDAANHVPVDFVSSHGYADDTVQNLFHTDEDIPMDDRVCRAIARVRGQIKASSMPNLPLFWTEWNVQGMDESRDTTFVGPAVANTVRQCDGNVTMMSFWTFSDVFEEGGPIPKPFEGEFGLRAKGGINKPSYYGFALLHQLGDRRLANPSKNVIVTSNPAGGLVIAAWNLVDPGQHGATRTMELIFQGVSAGASVSLQRVDTQHGNVLPRYAAMGKPLDPTPAQVEQMNRETALPSAEQTHLTNGKLELPLEPNALVLIKVDR